MSLAKIKVLAGLCSFPEALEDSVFLPCPSSWAHLHFLGCKLLPLSSEPANASESLLGLHLSDSHSIVMPLWLQLGNILCFQRSDWSHLDNPGHTCHLHVYYFNHISNPPLSTYGDIVTGCRESGEDIILSTAVMYVFVYICIFSQKTHNKMFLLVATGEGNWGRKRRGVGEKLRYVLWHL